MVYTIDELKIIIGDIAKQYGVKKVALFGSYSTGEETPDSDVDVITYNSLNRSLIKDSVKNEVVLYEQ